MQLEPSPVLRCPGALLVIIPRHGCGRVDGVAGVAQGERAGDGGGGDGPFGGVCEARAEGEGRVSTVQEHFGSALPGEVESILGG